MEAIGWNIVAGIFAIGGIALAWQGKEGWGWCFFLAACCHCSPS